MEERTIENGEERRIVIDATSGSPAWSPDGATLAFWACPDCGLYQSKVNGRRMRELGRDRGRSEYLPDFRPVIPTS